MKRIWKLIKAIFTAYIIHPILRWYNYYIRHVYIPDNERNHKILEYLIKIAEDIMTQPENPTEVFFEQQMYNDYLQTAENPNDEEWAEMRQEIAIGLINKMFCMRWIDDESWWRNVND